MILHQKTMLDWIKVIDKDSKYYQIEIESAGEEA